MKVELWVVGKTSFDYLNEGIDIYEKRLKYYLTFALQIIPDLKQRKSLSAEEIKTKEGEAILKKLKPDDYLILLDERGKMQTSLQFADMIDKFAIQGSKRIIFLIGGAYGFSEEVYERSQRKISLSQMTFSHQMVRLFFIEQLYRAMTILKNEPYHHE
jgi:23S rRNA (pseudouridine1915-N3)-methyltransferase